MKFQNKYWLLISLSFLVITCKKDHQYVPNAYVNLVIYVNDPANASLANVNGWKYFPGGNRGVVVYRKALNEFMAYDRTCPYKPEEAASIVNVDTTNNVMLYDASCSSKFLISDGTPISGPAVIGLKAYRTVFDGTILQVSN